MELTLYIYNFLQEKKPRVEVPNFGVFRLEKEHAIVDTEASKILPPSEHIYFEDNTNVFDSSLAHYISEKTGENLFIVQSQMRDIVRDWIKILLTQKKLKLKHLGEFTLNEIEIVLEDSRNEQAVDFFGLEEISVTKIEELKPPTEPTETQKEATKQIQPEKSNKGMIWLIVILLAVVILGVFFVNREQLFGKKESEKQTSSQQVTSPQSTPTEPVSIKDSITIDSVQVEY